MGDDSMRSFRFGARAGLGLASVLLSSTALVGFARAADTPAAAPATLGEVIVTATKREGTVQSVPMSIQALDDRTLAQQNVTQFSDYAKLMPSVTFQSTGPNTATVYMRGVASGLEGNHSGPLPSVGVYLDEQPITTIGGTLDVHIYDIARVEVLPGPQGTLYGASSEAGTLRIITKQPVGHFEAGYNVEGNYVENGEGGYIAEGFINVPVNDHVAVRLVGWDEHDSGYIDNVLGSRTFPTSGKTFTNQGKTRNAFNPADTIGGRAAVKIDLNDSWTITPTVVAQDQRNKGVFGYQPDVGDLKVQRFQPDTAKDQWYQAALTVKGKIFNLDLTYSGGYFHRKVDSNSDYADYSIHYDLAFGSGHYWVDNAGNPLPLPLQRIIGRDRFDKDSHEIRIASPVTDRFRFILGAFYERQTHWIVQDYVIPGLGPAVPGWPNTIWLTDQMRVDRDDAVFGEASFDITPKLTVTGGVRAYEFDNRLHGFFGFSAAYNALTGFSSGMGVNNKNCQPGKTFRDAPCVNLDKTVTGSGETWKANLEYRFDEDTLAYFTYSTGYRPGGVNRNGQLPPYQADKLYNYEIGWKSRWFDKKLTLNGALFYQNWDKFQFSFLGLNSLTVINNGPSADIWGAEVSFAAQPTADFSLRGGFTYTDAESKKFCGADTTGAIIQSCSDADAVILSGAQLPYTPKFKGDITARYDFQWMDWAAHAQATGTYQSETEAGLRQADIPLLGKMPGFGSLDLSLGGTRDNLSLDFFIKNVTDERGQLNRYTPCTLSVCGAAFPGVPRALYVVPIQPRLIGLRIGQTF
jgi:outer membrane receptor protein involved in Fe transport